MSTITKIEFWNDSGFTEGAVEVPSYAHRSVLPDPSKTYTESFNPSKGRMFSELKLVERFEVAQVFSYLRLTVEYNDSAEPETVYYGWIDSVEILSDTEDFPTVLVKWHVDLWRTYFAYASFGYGMIERRRDSGNRPPQNIPYRYLKASQSWLPLEDAGTVSVPITSEFDENTFGLAWLYVIYTAERTTESTRTYQACYVAPVLTPSTQHGYDGYLDVWARPADESSTKQVLTLVDVANGEFANYMGLVPSRVSGAYLTYVRPFEYTIASGTAPYKRIIKMSVFGVSGTEKAVFGAQTVYDERHYTLPTARMTTESENIIITDNKNSVVGSLPYGLSVKDYTTQLVISGSSMYFRLRFEGHTAAAEGLEFNIPLEAVPVIGNSWSEYAFTGQREYDIQQRKTANEMALYGGLAAAVTGGVSGYTMGALGEQFKNPTKATAGTISTAGKLGALGAVGALGSTITDYAVAVSYEDKLQSLTDNLQALQSENLMIPASTVDWPITGRQISITSRAPDDYSLALFQSQINLNGVTVSEPTADCTSLVRGSGPLQISNLIVKGSIPVEAKQYIKARLNNGVRLI